MVVMTVGQAWDWAADWVRVWVRVSAGAHREMVPVPVPAMVPAGAAVMGQAQAAMAADWVPASGPAPAGGQVADQAMASDRPEQVPALGLVWPEQGKALPAPEKCGESDLDLASLVFQALAPAGLGQGVLAAPSARGSRSASGSMAPGCRAAVSAECQAVMAQPVERLAVELPVLSAELSAVMLASAGQMGSTGQGVQLVLAPAAG